MKQIRSALSLFNGISGLHLALDKAHINVEQVYYSEIGKFANKVTEQHYPNERVDAIIVLTDGCYSDIDDYTFKNRDNMNSNNRWIFLMTEEHKSSAILGDSISVKMKGL